MTANTPAETAQTPLEALAQAIRDAAPNLPRNDLIIVDPAAEAAAAILDALPEGAALVVNWDEMTMLLQELGASQERERLRADIEYVMAGIVPQAIRDALADPEDDR